MVAKKRGGQGLEDMLPQDLASHNHRELKETHEGGPLQLADPQQDHPSLQLEKTEPDPPCHQEGRDLSILCF